MILARGFSLGRWLVLVALWLSDFPVGWADEAAPTVAPEPFDYSTPSLITGTLYEVGSERKKVLFTFQRTAVRTGSTVNVERKFLSPDGSVAASESAVYESGRLVSFLMKEFQANVSGRIQVKPDPKKPAQQKLYISYGHGLEPQKGDSEDLPANTVVDDTLYPFLLAHWDDLMRGDAVKFHFVSLEWERTFMFRLVKVGEILQNGRTEVRIKMEPTNLLVARLVDPLTFVVDQASPHRIISYVGRTTPRTKKGKSWKYLEAETVFDWK
jgi:hypothetical protein